MKLPNGYGSVVNLGKRRRKPYAARITTGWTEDGKQKKKYLGYYKTRQEAMKALADYNENPFDLATQEVTFAELYEKWAKLKYKDEPVIGVYVAAYKNLSALHNMRFSEIRKRHIQGVIDSCLLGRQAKSHMKTLCNQLFKYAIDQEIVATNFASFVEMPPNKQSEIRKPFTPAELKILWQNTADVAVRVALILCYTGLRPTELIEIKTANVHLAERYMQGGIKTSAGKNRIIPIAKKILPFISELYNPQTETLEIKDSQKTIKTYPQLKKLFEKNELLKNHLPHDGRHTCATLMDDAEIPLKIRQLILGHTSQDITNRVYTHKTVQHLIDAIDKI